jgi:hypothetical protein
VVKAFDTLAIQADLITKEVMTAALSMLQGAKVVPEPANTLKVI